MKYNNNNDGLPIRNGFFAVSKVFCSFLLISTFLLPSLMTHGAESVSDPVIILNPSNTNQALERKTLRAVFGMRTSIWPDGVPVEVFVLPDSDPLHIEFSDKILGMLPYNLRRRWDRLIFSGTGRTPTVVESQEQMMEQVLETPGAIGYIDQSNMELFRRLAGENDES